MKIYNQGRQINGRFSSFKSWLKKWVRRFIMISIIGLAFTGVGMVIAGEMLGSTVTALASTPEVIDRTPQTAEELKNDLALLIRNGKDGTHGEVAGRVIKEGEIFHTFDANQAMLARCMQNRTVRPIDCESYGAYQEKIGTIQNYAMQIYGKEITQLEAFNIANDEEKAKDFFLRCSIEIQGCVWNWSAATAHKDRVEVLIDTIRKLEKV